MAVAFAQRPGEAYTDTRIELSLDPSGFLSRVAQVWSPTGDLGHVHSSLFTGYLFPTGPYYALADRVGLSAWVAQRLWLGLVLAAAAWGAVRVLDELWSRERGAAHVVAGLAYVLNPFTIVTLATRGTGPLLTLAVLPWVLVAVHRALAEPRCWRWPIVAGLVLAAAGGAVNAAGIMWILLAAAALAVYEACVLGRGWGPLGSTAWRAGLCMLAASVWWIVPLALQATAGVAFQRFAEQPGTIWATTSAPESMRLLGFWVLYLATGFGNAELQLSPAHDLLFSPSVVAASFVLTLVAFTGLRWTRAWGGGVACVFLCVGVAGAPVGGGAGPAVFLGGVGPAPPLKIGAAGFPPG